MPNSVGYSRTPLAKKLGLKTGFQVVLSGAPGSYEDLIDPTPDGISCATRITSATDLVHIFATDRAALSALLKEARAKIRPDTIIWVSWPKKASKVPTDITEDTIRKVCLPLGLVDVKVCAVYDVWSGLKLVIRIELR